MKKVTKNTNNLEIVGELLYDLSASRQEGSIIKFSSNNKKLKGLTIDEIDNTLDQINEDCGALSICHREEKQNKSGETYISYSLQIDALSLRDYLIDSYGGQIMFWITFPDEDTIVLNTQNMRYKLSIPRLNNQNFLIFKYIFQNPNKVITIGEINEHYKKEDLVVGNVNLTKVPNYLGFSFELKRMFFRMSETEIMFKDKFYKDDLAERPVNFEKLFKRLSALPVYHYE